MRHAQAADTMVALAVFGVIPYLEGRVAKWWIPDDVVFADALSYGATGKIQKMELRQRFAGHYAESAKAGAA